MKLDVKGMVRRVGARLRESGLLGATKEAEEAHLDQAATATKGAAKLPKDQVVSSGIVVPTRDASAQPVQDPGSGSSFGFLPSPDRLSLGTTLRLLQECRDSFGFAAPALQHKNRILQIPEGARFEARSYVSPEGGRDYKLYVPSRAGEGLRGLVLMLHGCTQDPDDFAVGTGMNALAERESLIVAYPAQSRAHNAMACWNWFHPANQRREAGEPAILAGLVGTLLDEWNVEGRRAMVAGLSAGGSMAAVLGATYPDLFDAIGVHSGLPYRAASDAASAMAAMRGDSGLIMPEHVLTVRTIIFHGDADRTVHPDNAMRFLASAGPGEIRREEKTSSGGRRYRVDTLLDGRGSARMELWTIEGAGHAWSGGNPSGSYADPDGPAASEEMVRFFLEA